MLFGKSFVEGGELTRERGVQVHQLRCIDDTSTADCQERIWLPWLRKLNRLLDAAILGLHPDLIIDLKCNTLPRQPLHHLLHRIQLPDILVCNHHDALGAHVLEVHAHFLCTPWPEAYTRGRHLKGIFLLLRIVDGRGEVPARLVDSRGCLVVVIGIGMARTRGRMCELNSAQQVHSASSA